MDAAILHSLRGATSARLHRRRRAAESGLSTFRHQSDGLWKAFNPYVLATPEAFARDPSLVWGWYEWRRAAVASSRPNPAHHAIAAMARHVRELTVITQNVDDLHERAGSTGVVHLHGQIARPYCERCHAAYELAFEMQDMPPGGARIPPAHCSRCDGRIRPGVVWFGEPLPAAPWQRALEAAHTCDVLLCCGTSGMVYPAASLPEIAASRRVMTLQVNPNPTPFDAAASCHHPWQAATALHSW